MPSTSIRKSEYDPDTEVLSVWFVASGKRYDYEAVPAEVYAAFKAAFSKAASSISTSETISATA
ncbi:KTSC domain-containing protein [Oryzicola mucosus]|uniref:KTSC domain-containing protein n=1 Tax=Oryzicola mucosus TaxID=2767425 RepID=UPI001E32FF20|nr:KTSC domain-containing protein [Oryzicola mucosus]